MAIVDDAAVTEETEPQHRPTFTKQIVWGLGVLAVALLGGLPFVSKPAQYTLYMITGLLLGYLLARSRFGYAGGIKRLYMTGEASLTTALAVTFGLSCAIIAGIHYAAAQTGAVIAPAAAKGDAIIPGSASVKFIGIGLVIGGLLFGCGMMLAGGCASGSCTNVGEGVVRGLIALIGFVVGSVPGVWMAFHLNSSAVGKIGTEVYLPDHLGYLGAMAVTALALIGVWAVAKRYEQNRKNEGLSSPEEWKESEKPLPEPVKGDKFRFFSYRTYHQLFVTRWSFMTTAVLLAVMSGFIIITTKKSWGITSAFSPWGLGLLDTVGIRIDSPAYVKNYATVDAGLINDGESVRNVGIILGASVAMLLASRFRFDVRFSIRDVGVYALGGVLMGVGARLADGCNIGALYSAIGNFSLSGWLFGLCLWAGGLATLKIMAGRVNIISDPRAKVPSDS